MSIQILSRKALPAPWRVTRDRVHPEWRGLWDGLALCSPLGWGLPNLAIRRHHGTRFGGQFTQGKHGKGFNNTAAAGSSRATFPWDTLYMLDADVDFAFFVMFDFFSIDTDTGVEGHFVSVDDNAEGSWSLYNDSGSFAWQFRSAGGTFQYVPFGTAIPANNSGVHTLFFRRSVGGNVRLWLDGAPHGNQTNATTPVPRLTPEPLTIGGGVGLKTMRNVQANWFVAYVWKGTVPRAEDTVVALHEDPFGLIRPYQPRYRRTVMPAGVTGSVSKKIIAVVGTP